MDLIFSVKSNKKPGPLLAIHCPSCDAERAVATTYEQHDQLYLFLVVPTISLTNQFVECTACGALLRSSMPVDQLAQFQQTGTDLRQFLVRETSIVIKLLALLSVLLFCVPILGMAIASIATYLSWDSGGWTKRCSFVGLIFATMFSIGLTLLFALKQ